MQGDGLFLQRERFGRLPQDLVRLLNAPLLPFESEPAALGGLFLLFQQASPAFGGFFLPSQRESGAFSVLDAEDISIAAASRCPAVAFR